MREVWAVMLRTEESSRTSRLVSSQTATRLLLADTYQKQHSDTQAASSAAEYYAKLLLADTSSSSKNCHQAADTSSNLRYKQAAKAAAVAAAAAAATTHYVEDRFSATSIIIRVFQLWLKKASPWDAKKEVGFNDTLN